MDRFQGWTEDNPSIADRTASMAAGSSGSSATPATGTPSSSRPATRSAVRKAAADSSEAAATPTRKGRQKSLAAIAKGSAAGRHARKAASIPPSPLHPSLPRPPSWQAHLVCEERSPRRRRTSGDERDPGDSVDSTEDEDEGDDDHEEVLIDARGGGLHASQSITGVNNTNKAVFEQTSSSNEKQNICVCVRIRPSAPGAAEEEAPIWELDQQAGRIALSENHPIMEKRKNVSEDAYDFSFDALLLPPHPTSTMYDSRISQVVLAALEGYNGTIFSYGQTGSGKTHTMTGSDEEPGILPLAISDIFQRISMDTEREYLLRVSYLEIYNETLKDLLAPVKPKNVELRLTEDNRGRIVVNNIKEEIVNSPQDVLRVLTKGEDNRSVNCTDWNQRSSRSHCVFSMIIESRPRASSVDDDVFTASRTEAGDINLKKNPVKVEVRISQLNLIDLAGSERATSQEERRKEGAFINKSLLSLSNVIHKLADDKTNGAHIPYRDSKLTRLLQTSLSGNARIAIVCTISPEARHGTESVSTLKFAQRASKVITKAECGVVTDGSGALLANLQETIANLQAQLAKSEAQGSAAIDESALESEKQARQKAEEEAREQRMKIIQLTDQISHLRRQILTGTADVPEHASQVLQTPSSTTNRYGELGTGARPTGQRGTHRRLSELAFGLASPARLASLPASSSMRSISTALETIHSPSLPSDDERIGQLEAQLSTAKTAEQKLSEKLKKVETSNEALVSELALAMSKLHDIQQKMASLDVQNDDKTKAIAMLREEVNAMHEGEARTKIEHQTELSAVQMEVQELQKSLQKRDELIQVLQESKLALTLETSEALKTLQADLTRTRESLHCSETETKSLQETLRDYETREAENKAEIATLIQKARLAEISAAEKDSSIEAMLKTTANLESVLKQNEHESALQVDRLVAEKTVLEKQIEEMKRDHALSNTQLSTEFQQKIVALQDSLHVAQGAIGQQKAMLATHEQTIATLRADLEKKEQARIRLAQLKAANTPPDFNALQAKMQAVSGRSALRSLNSSLSSSTGSQDGSAAEQNEPPILLALKEELHTSKSKLANANETNLVKDQRIQQLEQRVLDLESSIAAFRCQIDKNQALLDELDGNNALVQKLQNMSVCSQTPERKACDPSRKAAQPLGVVSPHRNSASSHNSHRMAGQTTPSKKDSHGYTLHAKPPPLPLPPGTPEWRKQRRETREHEMNLLRSGGIASRTRTYLQSPKLENSGIEWSPRVQPISKSYVSHHTRSQKSSSGSVRSQTSDL